MKTNGTIPAKWYLKRDIKKNAHTARPKIGN